MGVRVKGVAGIKTLAAARNSGTHSNERHVHQFQIATLELERTRRAQEMKAALARIAKLEARLAEIDGAIGKHLKALGMSVPTSAGMPAPSSAGVPSAAQAQPQAEERRPKFRY